MKYHKIEPQPHGGVVSSEGIFFHSPSDFAKNHLYYIHFGGQHTFDSNYEIDRNYYHAFLLIRIIDGHLNFEYRGTSFTAHEGDVVLLDCKDYHHYWADDIVTFQWFHYDGCSSQAYFDMLYAKYGACFCGKTELYFPFNYVLDELKADPPNDHKLSFLIHNIIGILAIPDKLPESSIVTKARQYIQEHFQEDINVPDIAEHVALNTFYFSKLFKKNTGVPPHQYLTNIRIKYAKSLLSETSHGLSYISRQCGYTSESHFIRAFKKSTAITPIQFRKYFDPSGFKNQ